MPISQFLCLHFLMSWQQLTRSCDLCLCACSHSFSVSCLASEMHTVMFTENSSSTGSTLKCQSCVITVTALLAPTSGLYFFPLPHHSSTVLKPPTPDPSPTSLLPSAHGLLPHAKPRPAFTCFPTEVAVSCLAEVALWCVPLSSQLAGGEETEEADIKAEGAAAVGQSKHWRSTGTIGANSETCRNPSNTGELTNTNIPLTLSIWSPF